MLFLDLRRLCHNPRQIRLREECSRKKTLTNCERLYKLDDPTAM